MEERGTVVVAGATGYIGRHVARALHDAGYRVRALARDERGLEPIRDACDEVFVGEATRMSTLDGLCDNAFAVVSSLGLRSLRRRPRAAEVDLQANMNVLARAKNAGVSHFTMVSVLNAGEMLEAVPVLRPREEFVRYLESSGLRWTVLRPTGAFNDMREIFRLARRGWGITVGPGEHRINPIHPADVAEFAVRTLSEPGMRDREIGIGGPDAYTQRELSALAAGVLGRRVRVIRVPCWPFDLAAAVVRPVNANAAGFLAFFRESLSRDMVGEPVGVRRLMDFFEKLAADPRT